MLTTPLGQGHALTVQQHSTPDTSTGNATRVAGSQIWYTTELLEQVISNLPGVDIVVVSGVDKTARNCVANSSLAQTKMLLRPSGHRLEIWYYCEYRTRSGKKSTVQRQSFELVPLQEDASQQKPFTRPVLPVALCPILELMQKREEGAMDRIQRQPWRIVGGWRDAEYANLIGCPPENSRYFDMLLTDPPVPKVEAELTFAHNLYPKIMVRATRVVTQKKKSPITFRSLVESVRSQSGDVFVHEPTSCSMNRKSSVNHEIALQVQRHGGYFKVDPEKSFLCFKGVVVPSEQEWLDMDAKCAKLHSTLEV